MQIAALERQLDESKQLEKTFKQSAELLEQENDHLKGRLKNAIDENSNLKCCKCAADNEMITKLTKLMELETANEELRKDLSEKLAEIGEFEEENRSVCQKLDILNKNNAELGKKVRELQQQLAKQQAQDLLKVVLVLKWIISEPQGSRLKLSRMQAIKLHSAKLARITNRNA